jgi:hypothetical protein
MLYGLLITSRIIKLLFNTSNRIKNDEFDFDIFISGLTNKKMITLCFSILGFQLHTMAQYLGVSEKQFQADFLV